MRWAASGWVSEALCTLGERIGKLLFDTDLGLRGGGHGKGEGDCSMAARKPFIPM
jgi:hypothetical protein